MLTEDTNTLSKLGHHICYDFNNYEDRLSAMKYIFDLFSTYGIVNICLDKTTLNQLRSRDSHIQENPIIALLELQQEIENKKTADDTPANYQQFEERYNNFLNGLLDLYNNYQKNEKYQKRAQRVKSLWLKYIK
jgi:superfamily II RNA helicase